MYRYDADGLRICGEKFVLVDGRSRYGRIKPFPAQDNFTSRRHVRARLLRMSFSFGNVASQTTEELRRDLCYIIHDIHYHYILD